MTQFTEFFGDDTGAVTIDWLTLSAAVLLLGIMVIYAIFNGGMSGFVPNINDSLGGEPTTVGLGTIVVK